VTDQWSDSDAPTFSSSTPLHVLVLYLSNTHCLFLPAKNLLFELSCLLGVVTSHHTCHALLLQTTKITTEKGIPLHQGALGARWGDEEPPENEICSSDHVTDYWPVSVPYR